PRYLRTLGYKLVFNNHSFLGGRHRFWEDKVCEISSCEVCLLEDRAKNHIEAAQALLCLLRMQRATVRCIRDDNHKNTFASNIAQIAPKIIICGLVPAEMLQVAARFPITLDKMLVRWLRKLRVDPYGELCHYNAALTETQRWFGRWELAFWETGIEGDARQQLQTLFKIGAKEI
ncbi:MAG: hypothetical protein Q9208_001414, partial [Pyrenodesmia sp. 3 TL-2023]